MVVMFLIGNSLFVFDSGVIYTQYNLFLFAAQFYEFLQTHTVV